MAAFHPPDMGCTNLDLDTREAYRNSDSAGFDAAYLDRQRYLTADILDPLQRLGG